MVDFIAPISARISGHARIIESYQHAGYHPSLSRLISSHHYRIGRESATLLFADFLMFARAERHGLRRPRRHDIYIREFVESEVMSKPREQTAELYASLSLRLKARAAREFLADIRLFELPPSVYERVDD